MLNMKLNIQNEVCRILLIGNWSTNISIHITQCDQLVKRMRVKSSLLVMLKVKLNFFFCIPICPLSICLEVFTSVTFWHHLYMSNAPKQQLPLQHIRVIILHLIWKCIKAIACVQACEIYHCWIQAKHMI